MAMNPVWTLITVVLLLLMLVSWVLCWLLQTLVQILAFPFTTAETRSDICGKLFRGFNLVVLDFMNPLWRIKVLRKWDQSKLDPNRPYLFMFNHLSNADPWLCIRLMFPVDCKWICKGSLFKIPFGGWCLRNNGDLEVKFTKEKGGWGTEKGSVRTLMDDAAKCLRRNQPIAVFPEGVRNQKPEGPLGEFKPGFFDLAMKERAQIVPVAWSGNEHCWPVHSGVFGPATAYATVLDPIDTAKFDDVEALIAAVREVITTARESHPDRVAARKGQ